MSGNTANEDFGSWTFQYLSEDGNGHSITITAPTLLDAVDYFTNLFGEETSFIVTT